MEEKNVIAVATGNTYELVNKYSIHAHPAVSPYSTGREYLIPIKRGGTLEYIYKVVSVIECLPEDVEKYKSSLSEQQYNNLCGYTNDRINTYGFNRKNTKYRFFILEKYGDIEQPFIRKNIQLSVFYNLDEVPVIQSEETNNHQEWIIPCNADLYDIDGALRKLKIIDWYQNKMIKNAHVGDLVYIYCTSKHDVNRVKYKGAILAVNKYDNFIDDSEFDLTGTDDYKVVGPCFTIAIFREYDFPIDYKTMKEHGLKSKLMGPNKVKEDLSQFLHICDLKQKNSDIAQGILPDTCLKDFPIIIEENLQDGSCDEALDDSFSEEEKELHAEYLSLGDLEVIARKQSKKKPRESVTTTVTRERDAYIAKYAKRRANGICQLCGEGAPFVTPNGEPYLESHHIVWLSKGGEDSIENTVALCPNCHKKMHIVNDPEDVEKLKKLATEQK